MDLNTLPSTHWLLIGIFIVVVSQGLVTGVSSAPNANVQQNDPTIQSRIMKRMDTVQSHISDLTRSLGDLDEEISTALNNCLGLHSELCEALELDSRLKSRHEMEESWFPGKRPSGQMDMYKRLYNDLRRKRALVKRLSSQAEGAKGVIGSERKRSCNVNLGFHCRTQEVSDFADIFNFLESPESPGKRSVRSP